MKEASHRLALWRIPFLRDSAIVFTADVVSAALKFLAALVVARRLAVCDQGSFTLICSLVTAGALIACLGVDVAVLYMMGRRSYPPSLIVSNAVAFALSAGGIVALIGVIANPALVGRLVPPTARGSLVIAELCVVLYLVETVLLRCLLGLRKLRAYAVLRPLTSSAYLGIAVILLMGLEVGLTGAVLAFCLAPFFSVVLALYVIRHEGISFTPRFVPRIMRRAIRFGLRGYAGNLLQYLNYRVDMFIVAFFLSEAEVGLYSVAVLIAEACCFLPNAMCTVLISRAVSSTAEENSYRTPIVAGWSFVCTSLVCLCISLVADDLIAFVVRPEYAPAGVAVRFLMPGMPFLCLWRVFVNDLTGRGHPELKSYTAAVAFCITLIVNPILVPKLGMVGAAATSSVAYSVAAACSIYCYSRHTGTSVQGIVKSAIRSRRPVIAEASETMKDT